MLVAARPVLSAPRSVVLPVAEVLKCHELGVGDQDYVTATATVAAGGTSPGHTLLPAERLGARASDACVHVDGC